MGVIQEGNGGYRLFVFPMEDTFIVECVVDGINKGADDETTMDVGGMGRGISPSWFIKSCRTRILDAEWFALAWVNAKDSGERIELGDSG